MNSTGALSFTTNTAASEDLTVDNISQYFTIFETFAHIDDNGYNDNVKTMTMTTFHNVSQ